MAKMWAGRTSGVTDSLADELNSSIGVDCRMYKEDITGSMAHAAMLGKQGIITKEESEKIIGKVVAKSNLMEDVRKVIFNLWSYETVIQSKVSSNSTIAHCSTSRQE